MNDERPDTSNRMVNQPLIALDGKDILLLRDKRFWPRDDALKLRMEQLKC